MKKMNTPTDSRIKRPAKLLLATSITVSFLGGYVSTSHAQVSDDDSTEEIFELSPFTVDGATDNGYQATSTLSGSQLRTDLKDVGSAISVVTEAFLEDTGSNTLEDVLTYTTSTEVGGLGGNYGGAAFAGDPANQSALMTNPSTNTRIRGLDSADLTRDFFRTNIGMDSYNTSRIDINRGASALLYGTGSPAGIINNTLKTAILTEDEYEFSVRLDKHGSHRERFDMNKVIKEDVLGVRVIGLNDERRYQQDFTFADDRRIFATAKWTPKFANDSTYTEFSVSYENGTIDSNRPRINTPRDLLSTWWLDPDGDGPLGTQPLKDTGIQSSTGDNRSIYSPLFGDVWWDQIAYVFSDEESPEMGVSTYEGIRQRGGNPFGTWGSPVGYYQFVEVGGLNASWVHPINLEHEDELNQLGVDVYARGLWQTQNILDPSVFNFYDTSLEGPNKSEFNDFDATIASFSQTYLDGKLGLKLTASEETVETGFTNYVAENGFYITIDNNQYLRGNQEGSIGDPNPNAGRAAFASGNAGRISNFDTDAIRATAFYREDFRDRLDPDSLLAKVLGEHTVTATYGETTETTYNRNFLLYGLGRDFNEMQNSPDNQLGYTRSIRMLHYLGDPLFNASSPTNLNIPGVSAEHLLPNSADIWAFNANVDPWNWETLENAQILNFQDNIEDLYTGIDGQERTATNSTFVWQGNFLNDMVSTLIGYRKDTFELYSAEASDLDPVTNAVIPPTGRFDYTGAPQIEFDAETWTGSVVLHSPQFIKDRLPWDMDVSLSYNESENFDPGQVGFDVYGNPHPAPSGSTKDFGVLVTALEGKLSVKANWYKANSANNKLTGTTWETGRNEHVYLRAIRSGMFHSAQEEPNGTNATQPIPYTIMNDWMFGEGGWDSSIASQPLDPSIDPNLNNWRTGTGTDGDPYVYDPSVFDTYITQPLRVRATASPNSPEYVGGSPESRAEYPIPPKSELEQAYYYAWYNARSDAEFLRPIDPGLVAATNFRRDENGLWVQDGHRANTFSISDVQSEGFELEVAYNPNKNWRFAFNAAQQKATKSNVANDFDAYVAKNVDFWLDGWDTNSESYWDFDGYADISFWGGTSTARVGKFMEENVYIPYLIAKASEGRATPELREWRWNAIANYAFTDGKFSGLNLGGAARWQDEVIIGYAPEYRQDLRTWVSDLDSPFYADSELNFDFWIGFSKSIRRDTASWKVQLNVRNAFGDDTLIPVSAQPDGTIATARIPSSNEWSITNTISF